MISPYIIKLGIGDFQLAKIILLNRYKVDVIFLAYDCWIKKQTSKKLSYCKFMYLISEPIRELYIKINWVLFEAGFTIVYLVDNYNMEKNI